MCSSSYFNLTSMIHICPLPPYFMLLRLSFDMSYILYHRVFCMLFIIKEPECFMPVDKFAFPIHSRTKEDAFHFIDRENKVQFPILSECTV